MAAMADLFSLAMQYHRAGDLRQAEMLYRNILQNDPRHAESLHLLGVLADQCGQSELGLQYIQQALGLAPDFAEAHNNMGNVLRGMGRLAEATARYREAIRLKPDFADGYNNLGIALRQQGQLDESAATYRQALRLQPGSAFVHNNLGNVFRQQGKAAEALACYQQALRLKPDYPEAYNNIGTVLQDQGKVQEAVSYFQEALRLRPAYPEAHNNLGVMLSRYGQNAQALACYDEAIRLHPNFADARKNRGLLLHSEGQYDAAIAEFKEVLRLKPDEPTANHLLAALTGGKAPEQSAAHYVADLFDGYADRFEEHLQKVLKYRGPELLREALAAVAKPKSLDVIDLGCGTGLCGVFLRDWARQLIGVDLAGKMLNQARQRNIYDELIQADVTVPLNAKASAFDLAVAGDVFAYIGDLGAVFQAAAKGLRPGGHLAFWVEAHEGEPEPFVLRKSGRYAHSVGYIRGLAKTAGFTEISLQKAVARIERGQDIESLVVVLRAGS